MRPLLALIVALALQAPPAPPAGLPGADGPGSARIVWTQTSEATYVVAVRVRADGIRQVLFVSERADDRPVPYYPPVPSYQGKVWTLYVRAWAPDDRLEIIEEQREFKRLRWRQTWGPQAVAWRAWLPSVAQAP